MVDGLLRYIKTDALGVIAEIAERLRNWYNPNNYAIASVSNGRLFYVPTDEELTNDVLIRHILGDITIAGYTVKDDNTVRFFGWDVDAQDDEQAREAVKRICDFLPILPLIEYSGGKGYHVLIVLDRDIDASMAHEWANRLCDRLGFPRAGKYHVEAYPKQSKLKAGQTENGRERLGSALKVPLGTHPRTRKRSCFLSRDFEEIDALSALQTIYSADAIQEIMTRILKSAEEEEAIEQLADALAQEMIPGKRHDLTLYLSGFLALRGWKRERAEQLLRKVFEKVNDDEIEDRIRALNDTFDKHEAGESVAGYSRLVDYLDGKTLALLLKTSEAEGSYTDIAKQIARIRLGSGASWVRESAVEKIVYANLVERGRFLLTETEQLFYFDNVSRQVMLCNSRIWERFLFVNFGAVLADNFWLRVNESLILDAETRIKNRERVYRGASAWDETNAILYVYAGGDIVYRLDGFSVMAITNGDGVFFVSAPDRGIVYNVDEVRDHNWLWDVLMNDLAFTEEGAGLSANAQRAMLQAWFLSYFFRELMPTRPLLMLLGPAGSGKTTAARRLLRVLAGLDANVLDVLDDKPDFLRAVLEDNTVFVLDNLEQSRAAWLARLLDTIATGSRLELRKLYTTNEKYIIKPDAYVMLTGINVPFNKETVFERMLVLKFSRREEFRATHELEARLRNHYSQIWSTLLDILNKIVFELRQRDLPFITFRVRLADFMRFCTFLRDTGLVNAHALSEGITSMRTGQAQALAEAEGSVYPLLVEWISADAENAKKWRFINELHAELESFAKKTGHRVYRFRSGLGLRNHLVGLQEMLIAELGLEITQTYNPANHRLETQYRFCAK